MKIVVGVRYSVDALAALALLKQQGHELYPVYVRLGVSEQIKCPRQSREAQQRELNLLQQALSTFDLSLREVTAADRFEDEVFGQALIAAFLKEQPQSCLSCHRLIILHLFEQAQQLGAEFVATGHYARLWKSSQGNQVALMPLHQGIDASESVALDWDQHRLLSLLPGHFLARLILPLDHLTREDAAHYLSPYTFAQQLQEYRASAPCCPTGQAGAWCQLLPREVQPQVLQHHFARDLLRKLQVNRRGARAPYGLFVEQQNVAFGDLIDVPETEGLVGGKPPQMMVTGFQYSSQQIIVDLPEQATVAQAYGQVMQTYGPVDRQHYQSVAMLWNDRLEWSRGQLRFKGLNYVVVVLDEPMPVIPGKSFAFCYELLKGRPYRLLYLIKIVVLEKQSSSETEKEKNWKTVGKLVL